MNIDKKENTILIYAAISIILMAILGAVLFVNRDKILSLKGQNEEKISASTEAEKIDLTAVGLKNTQANAFRSLEDSYTIIIIEANLPEPEVNYYYEAWIAKKISDDSKISIGKMELRGKNYSIRYNLPTQLIDHKVVIVTIEDVKKEKPGKILLSGKFK